MKYIAKVTMKLAVEADNEYTAYDIVLDQMMSLEDTLADHMVFEWSADLPTKEDE